MGRRVVISVVLMAMAIAPGSARASSVPPAFGRDRPDAFDVRDAAAAVTDLGDPTQILAAEHDLLEKVWGVVLPQPSPKPECCVVFAIALGAGVPVADVDGDGLSDVVTRHGNPEDTTTFTARRGADGSVLWSSTAPGFAWAQVVGDVDGDGGADLLVLSSLGGPYAVRVSCDQHGCEHASSSDSLYFVSLRSGASGRQLWSLQYDNSFSYAAAGSQGLLRRTSSWKYNRRNMFVVPSWTGDIDGDGIGDVVVNSYDLADTREYASVQDVTTKTTTTRIGSSRMVVLRGDSGAATLNRAFDNEDGLATMAVAGQLTGSTRRDLLITHWTGGFNSKTRCVLTLCRTHDDGTERVALTAVDAATGSDGWTRDLGTVPLDAFVAYVSPMDVDLNGDGYSDLQRSAYGRDHDAVTTFSGRDGSVLWSRSGDISPFVSPLGAIDGGDDVLLRSYSFNADATTYFFERLDGATGNAIVTTSRTVPADGSHTVSGYPSADVDGDHVLDLFVSEFTIHPDHSVSVQSGIESGRLGAAIFTPSPDVYMQSGTDLTHDGFADVILESATTHPDGVVTWTISAHDVRNATEVWTRTAPTSTAESVIGDATGDTVPELLEFHGTYDSATNTYHETIAVVDGADGTTLWEQELS
jgi:hypothetical protein